MEGGFRLYSEDDVARVTQIRRLQDLLGLTLAEIKTWSRQKRSRKSSGATYRPDYPLDERIKRVTKRVSVTSRQVEIVNTKLAAMCEMQKDLGEKLVRAQRCLKN